LALAWTHARKLSVLWTALQRTNQRPAELRQVGRSS
jgi:hypothetical protein